MFHVEHFVSIVKPILKNFFVLASKCAIICSLLLLFTGCKEEEPNPELRDPIYKDLSDKAEKAQKDLIAEEKNLKSLIEALASEKIRTLGIKLARNKVNTSRKKVVQLRQSAKYLKIRAEHRKLSGRKAYRIAFKKGLPWPDPNELKRYKTNAKLRAADLNWNKRVPKLNHANPNFSVEDKE